VRGWQIKTDETRHLKGDGYLAAEAGQGLSENPIRAVRSVMRNGGTDGRPSVLKASAP
jgi:hypothetical protein